MKTLLFALACLAQLAVPLSLVWQHERTRSEGTAWRFQTAPVDPGDPFRGRYVRLAYAAEQTAVPMADSGLVYMRQDARMYAELAAGADGYARLVRLHQQRPAAGEYVDVFLSHMDFQERPDGAVEPARVPAAFVHLPFDRYYLPEDRAPAVEEAYMRASREAQARTWAEVKVRSGHAVLTGLVLDGKPAAEGQP